MTVLQMSLYGAVMILAVIVIRALAVNRLPKKTFIALWGIVLLRLLLPFSFPSPFSAYSFVNVRPPAVQSAEVTKAENTFTLPEAPAEIPYAGGIAPAAEGASVPIYAVIWAAGMAACALFFAVSYFKCRREFREALPVKNDFLAEWSAQHKIRRQIAVRQSGRISAPLTYGIFKPVILMPKNIDWGDTEHIEYILAHELVHIRHFDAAAKLFLTAALCVHWFNPLVWAMYVLANRDIELACDEAVVRSFGDTAKSAYARTLIGMEEKKTGLIPLCNNFSKNAIEERVTAIMKMKKITIPSAVIALALVLGTTAVFATSAPHDTDGGNITAKAGAHTTIFDGGSTKYSMVSGYFRSAVADESGEQTAPREPTRQELLEQYGSCGISFDASGKMLFNGKPVRHFIDESESGTFTFDSTGGGDIIVQTQYDKNGKLSGLTDKIYDDEYAQWGIEIRDGVYYYKNDRVRIFMDMRVEGSFKNFFVDENGKADVRLIRGAGGAATRIELIGETEAQEILDDLSDVTDDIEKQENPSEKSGTEGKNSGKIARLTKKDLSSELQAIIKSCDSTSWYVIENAELQYVFYDGLPGDYAFQLEGSGLKIVDMGESKDAYVLLAVPKNPNLSITYHDTNALIIRKTTKAQTKINGIA